MDETLKELGEYVADNLTADILDSEIRTGELMLTVRRDSIERVATFLRDDTNCQFKVLVDISGVDYPERAERFDVVYNLLSVRYNSRIRVKVLVDEVTPVESVAHVYPAAAWCAVPSHAARPPSRFAFRTTH